MKKKFIVFAVALSLAIAAFVTVKVVKAQSSATFFYVASSVDTSGLESTGFSNEATAVISNGHLVATATWTANPAINVVGYNLYRGKVSGGPYAKINTVLITGTTYTDTFSTPAPPTNLKVIVP